MIAAPPIERAAPWRGLALVLLALAAASPAAAADPADQVQRWSQESLEAFNKGDYRKAAYLNSQIVGAQGPSLSVLRNKAVCLDFMGDAANLQQCIDAMTPLIDPLGVAEGRAWRAYRFYLQGKVHQYLFDFDKAYEQFKGESGRDAGDYSLSYSNLIVVQGRFDEYEKIFARANLATTSASTRRDFFFQRGYVRTKLKLFDKAMADLKDMRQLERTETLKRAPDVPTSEDLETWMHLEWAGTQPGYSLDEAGKLNARAMDYYSEHVTLLRGIHQSRSGQFQAAIDAFDAVAPALYRRHAEGPFAHGVALLAQGDVTRAREAFVLACRLRPSLVEALSSVGGAARIAAAIKADLAELSGADVAVRIHVTEDQAAFRQRVQVLDAMVAGGQFQLALEEFKQWREGATAGTVTARVDREIAHLDGYLALIDKLGAEAKAGKVDGAKLGVPGNVRVVGADRLGVQGKIGTSSVTIGWGMLSGDAFITALSAVARTPDERLSVATLAYRLGREGRAHGLFVALGKEPVARISRFLADARGIDLPAGGFVVHGGRYVTPDEAKALAAGKVSYQGRWVTADEKRRYEQGFEQRDGQWVQLDDETLRRSGRVKHGGRWIPPEEVESLAGAWDKARTVETAHLALRSDRVGVLEPIADAVESAYKELETLLGVPYPSRIKLLVYKDPADYRRYLARFNSPEHAAAVGQCGMSASEPDTCCAHDRARDAVALTHVLTKAMAAMYVRRVLPGAPEWFVLGVGEYFGGSEVSRGTRVWGARADQSLLLRRSLRKKSTLSWSTFLSGSATLPVDAQARTLVVAQSWAAVRFLHGDYDPPLTKAFRTWVASVRTAGAKNLGDALGGDTALLEAALRFYIEDL